ncbi:MAG: hypothetical protein CLLPBCKN_001313 [Chroococcidiopsis cubana SAG 39.79]|nr:hypothetical protein [Chroococcidiopsis cubana SAG 39.79]
MLNLSKPQEFNCLASYVLEMVNAVKLEQLKPFSTSCQPIHI